MITRRLPVKLNREEVRLKGKRLAILEAEIESLEGEKKAVVDDFKSKIEGRKAEIQSLSRQVNEEQEYRQVEVVERKDWDELTVDTVRTDTGDIIESRPMTTSERQRPIPFNQPRMADDFIGEVLDEVSDQINAGAIGSDVKATRKRA